MRHKAVYPVLSDIHFRGLLKNVMTNLANQRNSTKASFTELFGDSRLSIFSFNLVYDLGKIIFQDNRVTHDSIGFDCTPFLEKRCLATLLRFILQRDYAEVIMSSLRVHQSEKILI